MDRVAFQMESHGGLGQRHGLLYLENESLVVEYQSKDSLFGVLKSAVKRAAIACSEIDTVSYKQGLFGAKLVFTFRSLSAAQQFSGSDGNRLKVPISRAARPAAAALAKELQFHLMNRSLGEMLKMTETPPPLA